MPIRDHDCGECGSPGGRHATGCARLGKVTAAAPRGVVFPFGDPAARSPLAHTIAEQLAVVTADRDRLAERLREVEGERDALASRLDCLTASRDVWCQRADELAGELARLRAVVEAAREVTAATLYRHWEHYAMSPSVLVCDGCESRAGDRCELRHADDCPAEALRRVLSALDGSGQE